MKQTLRVPSTQTNPPAEVWRLPDPVNPAAKLGRRILRLQVPQQIEPLRAAAKKLVWTAVEARAVRTPFRYAFRELVRPTVAEYQLRGGHGRIVLRHQSGDIDIFHKFYAYGLYDWPLDVITQLQSLGRPLNVVDLGANIGFFDVHTSDELDVGHVVAVEPDPNNAAVLERVRAANRANWQIIRACASNRPHIVNFRSGFHNLSRIDTDGDRSIPAVDVFPLVADADLVKMNIEGAEWDILEDVRLADTSCVWIVEYHRIANPEPRITELIQRLFEQAGFASRVVMNHDENGLLWAWKANPADRASAVNAA